MEEAKAHRVSTTSFYQNTEKQDQAEQIFVTLLQSFMGPDKVGSVLAVK